MQPLNRSTLFGNWATLLLPVTAEDQIDFAVLEQEIDALISMQVDGIYSNGTAGEFFNQSAEEFDQVNALLAEKCEASGTAFQIGCNHVSPLLSLCRTKKAVSWKPGALQVTLPDWVPTSMKETCRYLKRLMDVAGPIPLVLYNPPHAKSILLPEDYQQLQEVGVLDRLIGIKVYGGDYGQYNGSDENSDWFRKMSSAQQHSREEMPLAIFIPGHFLATGISRGAKGAYSNVACLHPAVAQFWYDLTQTDLPAALELEARIVKWMQTYIQPFLHKNGYSNMAADKLLASIGNWCDISPRLRWPYLGFTSEKVSQLRKTAMVDLPEFFDPELREYKKHK